MPHDAINDTGSRKRRIKAILCIAGILLVLVICLSGYIITSVIEFIDRTITMRWFLFITVIILSAVYWKKSHWAWKVVAGIILIWILYDCCKDGKLSTPYKYPSATARNPPRVAAPPLEENFPEDSTLTYGSGRYMKGGQWYKVCIKNASGPINLSYYFFQHLHSDAENVIQYKPLGTSGTWEAVMYPLSDIADIRNVKSNN